MVTTWKVYTLDRWNRWHLEAECKDYDEAVRISRKLRDQMKVTLVRNK